MSFGVDFGQKVDLTASIRNILRNYPEGTAILKELVQNADDAGARRISFTLDRRHHGTAMLAGPALQQFQGPALMVYNDATFTEDDFKSIQRIGDSIKKSEESKSKIGRFGIGFNSVYHITELPSFVSASNLVLLDPQAQFLPNVNPSNPGKMVNFVSEPGIVTAYRDQFAPYEQGYGVDWKKSYSGTLFRFPLRTEVQATASMLSKRAWSEDSLSSLLDSLRQEASAMLLFLKNVESISIAVWDSDQAAPTELFRANIINMSRQLRDMRLFVADAIRASNSSGSKGVRTTPVDYSLQIECTHVTSTYVENWEVCNQLGGHGCNEIASNPENSLLRLVPWGGVAAKMSSTEREDSAVGSITSGLAYCFLPLPVRTGLPIMVNGFFELSSNRRDVWQAGPDMTGDGKTRAVWNISLMRDIVAQCYVRLLARLRAGLGFSEAYQNFWPSSQVAMPWSEVVQSFIHHCGSETLLQKTIAYANPAVVQPASNANWISISQAVLCPNGRNALNEEDEESLKYVLIIAGCNLVVCNSHLRDFLVSTGLSTVVNPSFFRTLLRTKRITDESFVRNIQIDKSIRTERFESSDKICTFMLQYSCSDLNSNAFSGCSDLNGIQILPMYRGDVTGRRNFGAIRLFSPAEVASINTVVEMGYSFSAAMVVLIRHSFNVENAIGYLLASGVSGIKTSSERLHVFFTDESEAHLFRRAKGVILDKTVFGGTVTDFFMNAKFQQFSNIRSFEPKLIPDLLHFILPKDCFDCSSKGTDIKSIPADALVDLKQFIDEFWRFASNRHDVIAAIAEGPAMIPTRNGRLLPLSRSSVLLAIDTSGGEGDGEGKKNEVPPEVIDILVTLGVNIISDDFVSTKNMPGVFWDYVHSQSRSGIIFALRAALDISFVDPKAPKLKIKPSNAIGKGFESLSHQQRRALFNYFASCENVKTIGAMEHAILRSFPIFSSFSSDSVGAAFDLESSSTEQHVTLGDIAKLTPQLFPDSYLKHSTAEELALLHHLGVKIIKRVDYFKQEFIPNAIVLFATDSASYIHDSIEILVELPTLIEADRHFPDYLRAVEFIPSITDTPRAGNSGNAPEYSSELRRADEFYDPHDAELKSLLSDSFFPPPIYQRDDIISVLRSLGLQVSLDWGAVVTCAKSISILAAYDAEPQVKRGESLIRYLDRNAQRLFAAPPTAAPAAQPTKKSSFSLTSLLFGKSENVDKDVKKASESAPKETSKESYIAELNSINWIPVMKTIEEPFVPEWCDGEYSQKLTVSGLATAYQCRPYSDAWLCSASLHLCPLVIHSAYLLKALGWDRPLTSTVMAVQLRELSKQYQIYSQITSSESSEGQNNDIQTLREKITQLIPAFYQFLNSSIASYGDIVHKILDGCNWIWLGDLFVSPSDVAYSSPLNLSPYLHLVPRDLAVYSKLLNAFGVRQSFSGKDYVEVLRRLAFESGVTKGGADVTTLSETQTELALSLVSLLNSDSGAFNSVNHGVYLPDYCNMMALSSELVIDDVPWLSGPEYSSIRSGIRFLHSNIAASFATKAGVRSLRLLLIDRNVEQIFTVSDTTMEAFGQAESLTSRLRTILDMYPDGNPILSELIQNADDAGATVVRIMLDENSYECESLLNPSMAPLQGPALVVTNDAKFSEADFRSLASIGQGSKLEKLTATGRFGLGFNSVYHVTDTPSIVSGESLIIFDPHTTFVPGATLSQPGLRMKFHGSSLRNTFPDQFLPFEFFGCDMSTTYNGTLFRFPLRTGPQARKSEISKRGYSIADVDVLLQNLSAQIAQHLLFLRSVACIEIYRCRVGEKSPILLKRATAKVDNRSFVNDQFLMRFFDKKNTDISTSGDLAITSKNQFYDKFASTRDDLLPTSSCFLTVAVEEAGMLLNRSKFYIVSGIRGGSAKDIACDPTRRHLKLVPFGSIASCIERVSYGKEGKVVEEVSFPAITGQAFCFLPLPVWTKLPVHVNAYFELSSNRRDIWKADDTVGDSRTRGLWNESLMKVVLAPLYSTLIVNLTNMLFGVRKTADIDTGKLHPSVLLSLLPCPAPQDTWGMITSAFFPIVKRLPILWSKHKSSFLCPGETILIPEEDQSSADTSAAVTQDRALRFDLGRLETLLVGENMPIVALPATIYKTLVNVECMKTFVTPSVVREHYRKSSTFDAMSVGYSAIVTSKKSISEEKLDEFILFQKQNAAFLFRYCASDVPPAPFEQLFDIPLIPTSRVSGSYAALGGVTDPPLYLATDAERSILMQAGENIVAEESVLGSDLLQLLSHSSFAENFNIRRLTPIDILKLLRNTLPGEWFWGSANVVKRNDPVSNEWLRKFWGYVIENKCLDIFEGAIPMLPVYIPEPSSASSKEGTDSYLLKVSPGVPVLHMMFKDSIPTDVATLLTKVGLYIFDAEVLGNHSFAPEVSKSFCAPSMNGLLDAFTSVSKNLISSSATWNDGERDAMRNFVLELVARADSLNVNHLHVLRNMQIWKFTGSSAASRYGALELQPLENGLPKPMLPPKMFASPKFQNFVPALRDLGRFVEIRNERDRTIFEKLKVEEASSGIFYSNQIVPRLDMDENSSLDSTLLRLLSVDMLANLDSLEAENPGIKSTLKKSKFVETKSGIFVAPESLYDPTEKNLVSLLPDDAFPAESVYGSDRNALKSLRDLGMRTKLDCDSVLRAAQSIFPSALQLSVANQSSNSTSTILKDNVARAQGLLKYLDDNIETLMSECDPEFLKRCIRRSDRNSLARDRNNSDDADGDIDQLDDADELTSDLPGGPWGEKMRRISWVPVMQMHPSTSKLTGDFQRGLEKFLPWPEPVHRIPIAAPNTSVLVVNRWLCSSTYRIVDVSVQSDVLISVMGWKRPVPGNALAQQLLTLCGLNSFGDVSSGNETKVDNNYSQPQSIEQLYFIISRLYEALSKALVSESQTLSDIWLRVLRNKPIIWTGSQLVEPERLAFNWNIPLNTEPFLFVVKGNLLNYKPLLAALGVREHFDTTDVAGILRELQTAYGSSPLPDSKIDMCMGIINILLKLTYRRYLALSSEAHSNDVKLVNVAIDEESLDSQTAEVETIEVSADALNEIDPSDIYWKLALSEMGSLLLPDSNGILLPSHALCFNDASWMAELIQKHKFRFCHRLLEAHTAMLLGVKSLRAQLFTGDDVVCPKAANIKSLISEYSSADAIADICALADEVKAEGVHIMLDNRQYSCESLINPNLDETQGPAILMYMDGVTFDREMLSKLFSSAQELLSLPFSCKIERRPGGRKIESPDLMGFAKFGRVGLRLLSGFVLTDCLQVLTESFYYVYDPNGKYLLSATTSGGKTRETQRAQRCKLTGPEGEEFLSQFSDQVAPFRDATFGFDAPVWNNRRLNGTIFRLPLRVHQSEVSQYIPQPASISKLMNSTFHSILEGLLLFGSSVEKGSSWIHELDNNMTTEVLTMQLQSPGFSRSKIGKFCLENGWRKSTSLLGSLFKSYIPEAEEFRVKIYIREMKMESGYHNQSIESAMRRPSLVSVGTSGVIEHIEDWAVFMSMGLSKIRDLANQLPYSDIGCIPFVSVAARISPSESFADPSKPPPLGLLLCGGASVGISGLPFHINAPFLQDGWSRFLPLPTSQDGTHIQPSSRSGDVTMKRNNRIPLPYILQWNVSIVSTAMDALIPRAFVEIKQLLFNGTLFPQALSLYRYWPFLRSMSPQISDIARSSALYGTLAAEPLFFSRDGFAVASLVTFPYADLNPEALRYLISLVSVADVPPQISEDMVAGRVKVNVLAPAKARELMKPGKSIHCRNLQGKVKTTLELLRFSLSDLDRSRTLGDAVRRTGFREAALCPILTISDGSVRPVPSSPREALVFMEPAMYLLFPRLRPFALHPRLYDDVPLFQQNDFLETLHLGKFTPQFLEEHIDCIFPKVWNRCLFVECSDDNAGVNAVQAAQDALSRMRFLCAENLSQSEVSAAPTPLAYVILWKNILRDIESSPEARVMMKRLVDTMKDWPIVSIRIGAGRQKQLYASVRALPYLMSVTPSDDEDVAKAELILESIKLNESTNNLAIQSISYLADGTTSSNETNPTSALDWSWTTRKFDEVKRNYHCISQSDSESSSSIARSEIHDGGGGAETNVDPRVIMEDTSNGHDSISMGLTAAVSISDTDPLLPALEALNMPFIDNRLFVDPMKTVSIATPDNLSHFGTRLLHSISFFHAHNIVSTYLRSASGEGHIDSVERNLLDFDALSPDHRKAILQSIWESHSRTNLTGREIDMLKQLPLFLTNDGRSITIFGQSDVYWCTSEAVLRGLYIPGAEDINASQLTQPVSYPGLSSVFSSNPNVASIGNQAVILRIDEELREIYELVGAQKLTPAVAMRKFTLPALNRLTGKRRIQIVMDVASNWGSFRDDAALLELLKAVEFVPSWHYESYAIGGGNESKDSSAESSGPAAANRSIEVEDYDQPMRRASSVYSWTNDMLLEALRGDWMPRYFAPSSMRTPTMHAMMSDLGMMKDVDKEGLISLATDIQSTLARDDSDETKQLAIMRGRKLLHYVLEDNRVYFDTDLARRLGKIRFVPVDVPTKVEPGGCVVYSTEVCRFDQTMGAGCGALGFTIFPILPRDLSPPQNTHSSLGINDSPALDVVLRHLKNLTSQAGDNLDRWNSQQYPLIATFSSIYSYLSDRWRDISPAAQTMLRSTKLIPVGHTLAKPNQVFFRLTEDLSPFMHEIPRYFGAHEAFLKELGVRERPSPADYVRFLSELASECGTAKLNPNELKAVFAIIQSISSQYEQGSSGSINLNSVFIPDESGVLRDSRTLLFNDNNWLKHQLSTCALADRLEVYILHPSLSHALAQQLNVKPISAVLRESLAVNYPQVPISGESDFIGPYKSILQSEAFLEALLQFGAQPVAHSGISSDLRTNVALILSTINLRFVADLKLCLRLVPSGPHNEDITINDGIDSLSFVDLNLQDVGKNTIFVKYNQDSRLLASSLAQGLCKLFSIDPTKANTLASLIQTAIEIGAASIADVLAQLRIVSDPVRQREAMRGSPGTSMLESDAAIIELKPFRAYRTGEVVAFSDPTRSCANKLNDSNLFYGIVSEVSEPGNGGLRYVTLRTGGDSSVSLLSTEVYSFKSAKEVASLQGPSTLSTNRLLQPFLGSGRTSAPSLVPSANNTRPASSPLSEDAAAKAPATENKVPVVDARDVLGALHGLLTRAGIPVSMQNEELVSKILSLDATKKSLEAQIERDREELLTAREQLSKSSNAYRCQICATSDVNHVLVPCGHTVCGECVEQIPRNKCPFCRAVFRDKVRFYTPDSS